MRSKYPIIVGLDSRNATLDTSNKSLKYDAFMRNCYVMKSANGTLYAKKRPALVLHNDGSGTKTYFGLFSDASNIGDVLSFNPGLSGSGATVTSRITNTSRALSTASGNDHGRMWAMFVSSSAASYAPTSGNESLIVHDTANVWLRPDPLLSVPSVALNTLDSTLSMPLTSGNSYSNGVGFLDGYTFIGERETGRIYNSNLDDPSTWSGDYIAAESSGDQLVHVTDFQNFIVGIGTDTIQFFYDAGNPTGSPLSARKDLIYRVGVLNTGSLYSPVWKDHAGNFMALVGISGHNQLGVYIITENLQLTKISDEFIDWFLNNNKLSTIGGGTAVNPWISGFSVNGKYYLVVSAGQTADTTHLYEHSISFVYDLDNKIWYHWNSPALARTDNPYSLPCPLTCNGFSGSTLISNAAHSVPFVSDGYSLWAVTEGTYQDSDYSSAAVTITTQIQTKKLTGNSEGYQSSRKFHRELALIGDRGSSTNDVTVQWSDDDYETWNTGRTLDINNPKNQLTHLGSFYERAFRFTHTANSDLRLAYAENEIDTGYS